jgi:HNH endonuclease
MTARYGLVPRSRRRRYSRTRRPGSLATWAGLYGRDSRYRIPDARCRYGYRLTPGGARARLRLKSALCFEFASLIAGFYYYREGKPELGIPAAVLGVLISALGTALVALYAWYRWRVNHRELVPQDLPAGTTRVRKPIPRAVKAAVWRRDGGKCRHCGITDSDAVAAFGVHLHYDHIIPFSLGGPDTEDNIQLLCEPENLAKSNKYIG